MINPFILLFSAVFMGACSQMMLKAGVDKLQPIVLKPENALPLLMQVTTSGFIIGGIMGYAISMMLWLVVLSKLDLGVAYPMVSTGYLITAIGGYYFFNEALTPLRIIGILVIMLGVYLVSRTA